MLINKSGLLPRRIELRELHKRRWKFTPKDMDLGVHSETTESTYMCFSGQGSSQAYFQVGQAKLPKHANEIRLAKLL